MSAPKGDAGQQQQRPPKESAVDLAKFLDKPIRVKLAGGREGRKREIPCVFPLGAQAGIATPIQALPTNPTPILTTYLVAVQGVLKGYDQLLNLVIDEADEYLRGEPELSLPPSGVVGELTRVGPLAPLPTDPEDPTQVTDERRRLGLIVARGPAVMMVAPTASWQQIENPFLAAGEGQ